MTLRVLTLSIAVSYTERPLSSVQRVSGEYTAASSPLCVPPLPLSMTHVAHEHGTAQMMRQGANSAVRFTTYSTLKQFVQGTARPGQTLPSTITFGIGAVAGLVTVYTTMPLECV